MKIISRKKQLWGGKGGQKKGEKTNVFVGSYWKMFDIPLFSRDKIEVLNLLEKELDLGTKKYWVATVNPEFIMATEKYPFFGGILKKTSLNVIDGVGLIWARELNRSQGNKLINGFKIGIKVLRGEYRDKLASGSDLMGDLARMARDKGWKMFLLGGFENRAELSARKLISKFGLKEKQISWSEGEPSVNNKVVVEQINKFKPDILLVAYGMKKQEEWIDANLKDLDVGLIMGVGRSFDYYSGHLKRAPEKWRKLGLEWLYSLIKEPRRIKRQLALPKFIHLVLSKKYGK